jgi:hypothetical protein
MPTNAASGLFEFGGDEICGLIDSGLVVTWRFDLDELAQESLKRIALCSGELQQVRSHAIYSRQ